MPKLQKKAVSIDNVTHPKGRKAIKMFKESKKHQAREKSKMATYVKQNVIGEKMLWFKERLPSDVAVCTKSFVNELLQTYLKRFDEEFDQIKMKHAIGQRKNRQHASREDMIRHTQENERREYDTCGIELPNLLDEDQVKMLQKWNGELRFLQNFKLVRLGKKNLQDGDTSTSMDCSASSESSSKKPAAKSSKPTDCNQDDIMTE